MAIGDRNRLRRTMNVHMLCGRHEISQLIQGHEYSPLAPDNYRSAFPDDPFKLLKKNGPSRIRY